MLEVYRSVNVGTEEDERRSVAHSANSHTSQVSAVATVASVVVSCSLSL